MWVDFEGKKLVSNQVAEVFIKFEFHPKIIIRTAVPSTSPFNPGPQHDADFTDAFKAMVKTIEIVRLFNANAIMPEYQRAFDSPLSTILVEYTDFYRNARAGR